MKILGIDYGRNKIGLAVGVAGFSEPLKVLRISSKKEALSKIHEAVIVENPDKIVVGISEGEMAIESRTFAKELQKYIEIQVDTFDETLTSFDAQNLSRVAGIGRKKRKEMEDAYAATIMLQNYIDQNKG